MNSLLVASIRTYLRTLARIAPKTAGRQAFKIFCTPRLRATVPSSVEGVMDRAEQLELAVEGHRVAGYRWAADSPEAPRVLLTHGWESRAARLAVWVEPLLAAGCEVVSFDAPGHGLSSGQRSNPMLFTRALLALADEVGPPNLCVAHSLGGACSILSATNASLLDHEDLPIERFLILAGGDSAVDAMTMFCQIVGLGKGFLPLILDAAAETVGRPVTFLDVHRNLPRKSIPTLWLHDPEDDDVPFEAAERVERACPHVQLERLEGVGHNRIVREPEVIARGVAFLTEAVSETAVA
jgi:pimeloyl-ACP methyl ester carboxylesterase